MRNERTITRTNTATGKTKSMTAKEAFEEITKTAEGQNLCDEWAVENEEIFENILEGAGTLEINGNVYSYNILLKIKRTPYIINKNKGGF